MAKDKSAKKINHAEEVVTRDYTIHLKKLLHGISFKKRAPRAVKEVKAFAKKMMGTEVRCTLHTHAAEWLRGSSARLRVTMAAGFPAPLTSCSVVHSCTHLEPLSPAPGWPPPPLCAVVLFDTAMVCGWLSPPFPVRIVCLLGRDCGVACVCP